MRITSDNITRLTKSEIFVYGSNLAGRHGAGAALTAYKKFGASWGRCHGLDNQTYGIPTKDSNLRTLPIERIQKYVSNFLTDAAAHNDLVFYVTAIGTGLAGYGVEQMAPLFEPAIEMKNIYLPEQFWKFYGTKAI